MKLLSYALIPFLVSSCMPRAYHQARPLESDAARVVASPTSGTYLFTWSQKLDGDRCFAPNDAGHETISLPEWRREAEAQLSDARERNLREWSEMGPGSISAVAGYGIYFAEDPTSSREYGCILHVVHVAPTANAVWVPFKPNATTVGSDAKAIVYQWVGRFSGMALALRDSSILDGDVWRFQKRKPVALADFEPPARLREASLPELVEALLPAFDLATSVEVLFAPGKEATTKEQYVSDLWLQLARPDVMKTTCTRAFSDDVARARRCETLVTSWLSSHVQAPPSRTFSAEDFAMVTAFFKEHRVIARDASLGDDAALLAELDRFRKEVLFPKAAVYRETFKRLDEHLDGGLSSWN